MPRALSPPPREHASAQRPTWWRREGPPRAFRYLRPDGKQVKDAAELDRIRRLGIPPAWRDVHISPSPRSRVQAVGVDAAGRLQYRYHARFSQRQSTRKFGRIELFGEYLPQLRHVTSEHLSQPGLTRDRVLALMVRLVERLHLRTGTRLHARRYGTFGLTTLQKRHMRLGPHGEVLFAFPGKHRIPLRRLVLDRDLVRVLWELRALSGTSLFQYVDDHGRLRAVDREELNAYVKQWTSPAFTVKDLRTWAGTLRVAQELARLGPAANQRQVRRNLAAAVRCAAAKLNNTPAVCRRSYLHPAVVQAYEDGVTLHDFDSPGHMVRARQEGFTPHELGLLELFQRVRTMRSGNPPLPRPLPAMQVQAKPVTRASPNASPR